MLQKTAARIGYLANKLQTGTIIRRLQAEKKNSIMANFSNKENKKMDIFEETKNKLDIVEVAEYYGIELNKQNKCCCPVLAVVWAVIQSHLYKNF